MGELEGDKSILTDRNSAIVGKALAKFNESNAIHMPWNPVRNTAESTVFLLCRDALVKKGLGRITKTPIWWIALVSVGLCDENLVSRSDGAFSGASHAFSSANEAMKVVAEEILVGNCKLELGLLFELELRSRKRERSR